MKLDSARAATMGASLLAVFAGGGAGFVFVSQWSHGDEPTIALILLIGVFLSVLGISLATFSAVRLRYRIAWVVVGINSLVLLANLQGFRLF